MAIADKLTKLSTDITNAYEAIDDKGGTIPANKNTDNLENAIRSISSGHLDNTEYQEAIDDLDDILEGSTPMTIYPPDWSEIGYEDTPEDIMEVFSYAKEIQKNWDSSITSMANKYNSDYNLKYFPLVDTSNVTNMYRAFFSSNLSYLPLIDISKVSSISGAFQYCENLISVPLLNFNNIYGATQLFSSCTNLVNVPLFNFSKVTDIDRTFENCPKLSEKSLNNILEMCINSNVTNNSYKKLSRVGLSSAQATICQTLSNYQAFLDAGWTTGY